jgi:hypothetical protein
MEAEKLVGSKYGTMEEYGWFTEGFDTRDLKEAKALVEQLSV